MMPNLLNYSRNRCTSVEQLSDHTLKSCCRLQDTLMDASVEIMVQLPDLDITDVKAEVHRSYREECMKPSDYLKSVVGTRIGPGMLKIIKGLVGETEYCKQLAFMVEECCHGVILSFTKGVLDSAPDDEEGMKRFFANMIKDNIRLYNRCAAFAPGSSITEGIEPPE